MKSARTKRVRMALVSLEDIFFGVCERNMADSGSRAASMAGGVVMVVVMVTRNPPLSGQPRPTWDRPCQRVEKWLFEKLRVVEKMHRWLDAPVISD
jgi:hypothetical protein